jgi:hypothetical protein
VPRLCELSPGICLTTDEKMMMVVVVVTMATCSALKRLKLCTILIIVRHFIVVCFKAFLF